MASAELHIELAYSPAPRQVMLHAMTVAPGTSVLQALQASPWASVKAATLTVGIWGRRVPLSQALREGDRVEVYRGLKVDPKEARRVRYRAQGDRGRVRRKKPEPV